MTGKYKNPTPDNRTIVDGIWSDIMDKWENSLIDDGDSTSQSIIIGNLSTVVSELFKANFILVEQNQEIIKQLKLLNLRTEEAFNTKIEEKDIGE